MQSSRHAIPRHRWLIVAGALLGLMVGNGPVMQFTFGVFLVPVSQALNANRGTLSLALLVGLVVTGIATPFIGWATDRFGVRKVALIAIVLFAAGMAGIGIGTTSAIVFICLYGLTGIAAAGQSPLTYCKVIVGVFDEKRGFALGVAMAGVGLGAALMPQLARLLIFYWDWRAAYLGLAALTLVFALPAMAFLVTSRVDGLMKKEGLPSADSGLTGRQAVRTAVFWKLVIIFFVVAMVASGMTAHLVPLLMDRGITVRDATGVLSMAGIALIAGRLIAGYLLDFIFAPFVATFFFAMPLIGTALLLTTSTPYLAFPGAVLIGLGLGAEVDLIAFLLSRYLGLRAFGQIYGYLFAVFMLGSGVGPFLMGMSFQQLHSYVPAMWMFVVLLALVCILTMRFGSYVYGVVQHFKH